MELEHSIWLISLIALTAGALIGALAYRFFAPTIKQAGKVKSELDDAREELNHYKAGVTEHFDKTAELVNDLAQNYVKVYQHLADGAQTLGASKTFKDLMEQHQGKVAIAVDEQSGGSTIVDDSLSVAPVVEQEEAVVTPIDYAEPPAETNTDEADPEPSENDAAETDVLESTSDSGEPIKDRDSAQDSNSSDEDTAKKVEFEADRLQ